MQSDGLHKSEKDILRSFHLKESKIMLKTQRFLSDISITRNLITTTEFKDAENIFIFVGVGHEIDTHSIIKHALKEGKRVYIPYCLGKGIMHAARLNSFRELRTGMYGIPTVPEDNEIISPGKIDLIVVPAVCFDRRGHRLGRGGGYYDRYLEKVSKSAVTVGICRAAQLLDSLSVMPHDKRVRVVITEREILAIK